MAQVDELMDVEAKAPAAPHADRPAFEHGDIMIERDTSPTAALALGRDLMLAGSRLRDAVGRRAQREFGITALQAEMILLLAGRRSMISTELAMACGVNASTVTHAVDAGIERGLMGRERNTADRRLVDIALTALGKRMADRVRTLVAEVAVDALRGMQPPDLARFATSLSHVGRNLEKG